MNLSVVRLIAILAALFMVAALFIGGSQQGAGSLFPAPWDKVVHVSYFFLLAVIMHRYVRLSLVFTIAIVLLIGAADEVHQYYVPGRTAAWDDWFADVLGAGLAILLLNLVPGKLVKK